MNNKHNQLCVVGFAISGIIALLISAHVFAAPTDESSFTEAPQSTQLSPWSLPDAKGNVVDFSPHDRNEYRIVLFWATWCPYCKALMPHLEAFRAKNKSAVGAVPIEFLALNVWEDSDPEVYLAESGYQFRLVPNADQVAKKYGVKGTPGLFLVNNDNEVLYTRRSGTSPEQVITDLEFIIENYRAGEN